jgi:hypothetical protein
MVVSRYDMESVAGYQKIVDPVPHLGREREERGLKLGVCAL